MLYFLKMGSFDADRFIVEVEQRPAIWDSRCDEYSNKLSRGRAWEELCDIFVPDFNEMDSLRKNKAGGFLYHLFVFSSSIIILKFLNVGFD